jgi:hypothetical protein
MIVIVVTDPSGLPVGIVEVDARGPSAVLAEVASRIPRDCDANVRNVVSAADFATWAKKSYKSPRGMVTL